MKTYSVILQEESEEFARNFAQCFDFSESEESEEYQGRDHQFVDSVNGIDIYYHYGSDYYFFTTSNN